MVALKEGVAIVTGGGSGMGLGIARRFAELGTSVVSEDLATPEAHRERLQSQLELWKGVFESAGVQPQ